MWDVECEITHHTLHIIKGEASSSLPSPVSATSSPTLLRSLSLSKGRYPLCGDTPQRPRQQSRPNCFTTRIDKKNTRSLWLRVLLSFIWTLSSKKAGYSESFMQRTFTANPAQLSGQLSLSGSYAGLRTKAHPPIP